MTDKDISIVIVNYNVKDFLLECLRSVENSTGGLNVETIVVDNDSKDGSVEFLKPLFPNVKFISLKENVGFGRANNIGFKESKGKYILILNPDTILEETTLSTMYDYMEKHGEVGISGCKVLNSDGSFQPACRRGFPTPWASFSKLFGLQKLFPGSKLFGKYNQTFRSVDETYYIDAVIGAFMFCRREVIEQTGGFDPDFFMYGEDIDLCFRAHKAGWKIAYVHSCSIIHYKGESTRRSSINDVKHFYNAMEIFTKKHYSRSFLFLIFLRLGIFLRSVIAYLSRYRQDIALILYDLAAINGSMLLASYVWRDRFFAFPDYAYPTVFIVVSVVLAVSMTAIGEYFEGEHTARRSFFGLMISFFILSSLTYFFKEYAFSRGVLLLTIGFTTVLTSLMRLGLSVYEKTAGRQSDRRIALVGINNQTEKIIQSLQSADIINADIVGMIGMRDDYPPNKSNIPMLGSIDYLERIISDKQIQDVIITDPNLKKYELIKILGRVSKSRVRFHVSSEYEEFVASKIAADISGEQPAAFKYNLTKLRYMMAKRLIDIGASIFLLTIGLPVLYLLVHDKAKHIRNLWLALRGKYSIVGLYPVDDQISAGKTGLTGIAHISRPERLSKEAIRSLNTYYIQNFTLSLDLDIILKQIFRKRRGN